MEKQHRHLVDKFTSAIGSEDEDPGPSADELAKIRQCLCEVLNFSEPMPEHNPSHPTPIDYVLLERWVELAQDPDDQVCLWLRQGAPAGLSCEPESRGIFPLVSDTPDFSIESTDPDMFENYSGVEESEAAFEEISVLWNQGSTLSFACGTNTTCSKYRHKEQHSARLFGDAWPR
jgi:hypothetical protein